MTKYFFLESHLTNEMMDCCLYALVTIDDAELLQLATRRKAYLAFKEKDRDLGEMHFIGGTIDFYRGGAIDLDDLLGAFEKEPRAIFDDNHWVELDFQIAKKLDGIETDRVEVVRTIVCESGVQWQCMSKHADMYSTTEEIPWAELFKDVL